jgi:hypothetical protein
MTHLVRKTAATASLLLILGALAVLTAGGCPIVLNPTGPATDGSTTDGSTTDGPSTTAGDTGETAGTTVSITDTGEGSTGGAADTEGDATQDAGDTGGDATIDNGGGTSADDFSEAAIIHYAAGGFPAYPKYHIPAEANYNVSEGGIQSSVQIPHVSKDGDVIWFATQDGNGFVDAQLFCMNADGSGLQEIPLPADLPRMPTELAPSADGEVCALIIDTGQGTDFSQSTVRIADRRTGTITLLYDGRLIPDGKDDFSNVQITDDGLTVYFLDIQQNLVSRIPASGGSVSVVSTTGEYTRTGCTQRGLLKYRINGDASALLAHVSFWGPDSTYPEDAYLKTNADVVPLTSTGDLRWANTTDEYLGVSDDQHYATYVRYIQAESSYAVFVYDRTTGHTTRLPTGWDGFPVLLDSHSTVIYTAWAIDQPYSSVSQLPGLGTPDGSTALEIAESYWRAPTFNSMSSFGTVLVGSWDNGAFGDPSGLYAWFPGTTSYRDGPSIAKVEYKFDPTADTLTVRVGTSGPVTYAGLDAFYDNFEAVYQLPEDQNPFFNERWGSEMAATDQTGVYEYTANLRGIPVDDHYRIRITVADGDAMNFACVDFRPVPRVGESLDANGDGQGG